MNKEKFPKKVTKDNSPQLVEKAKKFKKRAFWLMIAVVLLYSAIGLLILPFVFYSAGWLLITNFPTLSSEIFWIMFLVVFSIMFLCVLFIILDLLILSFKRFLGLPRSEEKVFAGCFIIANHLVNDNRERAVREVNDFIVHLSNFLRDTSINKNRRGAYSPEFKLLMKAKTQISRMLLFSDENIAELLMNFGLAFVRRDHQQAFQNLRELVQIVKGYDGEPKGRFDRLVAVTKQSYTVIILLATLVGLAYTILKMLEILGML